MLEVQLISKELELLITEEDLDIIGITEIWLNDKISDEELSIRGYTLFRMDRNDSIKSRGGVLLYMLEMSCNLFMNKL